MTNRRTWDIPPEPGMDVTRVRDCEGDCWWHVAPGSWVQSNNNEPPRNPSYTDASDEVA